MPDYQFPSATDPPFVTPRKSQRRNDYYNINIPRPTDDQISFMISVGCFIFFSWLYESSLFNYFLFQVVGGTRATWVAIFVAFLNGLFLISIINQLRLWVNIGAFGRRRSRKHRHETWSSGDSFSAQLFRRLTRTIWRNEKGEEGITTIGEIFRRSTPETPSKAAAANQEQNRKIRKQKARKKDRSFADFADRSWDTLDPNGPEILQSLVSGIGRDEPRPQPFVGNGLHFGPAIGIPTPLSTRPVLFRPSHALDMFSGYVGAFRVHQSEAQRAMSAQARTVRTPKSTGGREMVIRKLKQVPTPADLRPVRLDERPELLPTPTRRTQDEPPHRIPLFAENLLSPTPLTQTYQSAVRDGPTRKPPGPGFGGAGFKGAYNTRVESSKSVVDGMECVNADTVLGHLGLLAFMEDLSINMESWVARKLLQPLVTTIQQVDRALTDLNIPHLTTDQAFLPYDAKGDVTSVAVRSLAPSVDKGATRTLGGGLFGGSTSAFGGSQRYGAGAANMTVLRAEPLRLHEGRRFDKTLPKAQQAQTGTGTLAGSLYGSRPADAQGERMPGTLVELVERYGSSEVVQERIKLERYFTMPGYANARMYILRRLCELCFSQLGSYRYDGGSTSESGQPVFVRGVHPTDAEIVMHIWSTFFDLALPEQIPVTQSGSATNPFGPPGGGSSSLFGGRISSGLLGGSSQQGSRASLVNNVDWAVLDSRPFSSKFYLAHQDRLSVGARSPSVYYMRKDPGPHFCIYCEGRLWNLPERRRNLFDTLTLFIYIIQETCGNHIEALDLGATWLGLSDVLRLR